MRDGKRDPNSAEPLAHPLPPDTISFSIGHRGANTQRHPTSHAFANRRSYPVGRLRPTAAHHLAG